MTLDANEIIAEPKEEIFLGVSIQLYPKLPCFNGTARHCKYQFTVSVHPRGNYYHYTGAYWRDSFVYCSSNISGMNGLSGFLPDFPLLENLFGPFFVA